MARLRIALFATRSRFSESALRELAREHDVVTVALARTGGAGLSGILRRIPGVAASPLHALARELRVPVLEVGAEPAGMVEAIGSLRADLLCIATFPWRVPAELVDGVPLGAINAHPSLLPRHRGPMPLFWTYHAGDRLAGVTVHHASRRLDAGDIILQEQWELPRGHPVSLLDARVAERAGPLLGAAAAALVRGDAPRLVQDDAGATSAPVPTPGAPMVAFESWDVEQVWHFLAALRPLYREPLADERGRPVAYERVLGFRRADARLPAGTVESSRSGWELHCRGGTVQHVPAG
jgi:methionyl-tRNA formyltransferase